MSPNRSGGRCGARDGDACDAGAEAAEPCGDASAAGDVLAPEFYRDHDHREGRQSM